MADFTLIVRKNVNMFAKCENELMISLTKEEIVQQIRSNCDMYTEYVPSTTMVMEKMDEHLISCSSVSHTFFEMEPVCSITMSEVTSLQLHLLKCFIFIKHLSGYGKKMFFNKYLFDLKNLDTDTFKFWLDPPHFESSVDKLLTSLYGFNFTRDIRLKKYKQHLQQHFDKCKGPCRLNIIGVPICKKNKCEIDKLNKMYYSLYIFMEAEGTVKLKQILFDMIYKVDQYDNVLEFIAINATRNTKLQKIINCK